MQFQSLQLIKTKLVIVKDDCDKVYKRLSEKRVPPYLMSSCTLPFRRYSTSLIT